ncbi:hypothetical protein RintRC_6458 [Richelia intracellularis]|nr:hypothetical protein RintRC_6458 [Richelia intracellularis]
MHRVWNCSCFFTFYKPIPSSTFLAVNTTVVDLSFIILISYCVLPKESHPIHLLTLASLKQISNLSEQRCWILQFFGAPCRKYYLLC